MTFEMITLNTIINPSAWAFPFRLKINHSPFLSTYGFQILMFSFSVSFANRERIKEMLEKKEPALSLLVNNEDN